MVLNSIEDREKWLSLISFLPAEYQDIYYHPDYISLNCLNKNSQGFLFFNKENSKLWINPFIRTKVPNILGNNSENFLILKLLMVTEDLFQTLKIYYL